MGRPEFVCGECGAHLTPEGKPKELDTEMGAHCPLCGTRLASLANQGDEPPDEEKKPA